MKHCRLFCLILSLLAIGLHAQRSEQYLEKGWRFAKGDAAGAEAPAFDDASWEQVTIPHDWAIYGPFDRSNDLQNVAVTQNFESEASVKTGRTGGLPYVGVGWYRTTFDAPADKQVALVFDGAMSEARVYVNGKEVGFWPWGYNSFHLDVTPYINKDGQPNTLAVRLENRPQSSRWYPGAGLYRNVHVVVTEKVHVPVWGTQLTTPHVGTDYASVKLLTTVANAEDKDIRIVTEIVSPEGKVVAEKDNTRKITNGQPFEQNFLVDTPALWSPETPAVYKAVSKIYADNQLMDEYTTRFGIRSIEYVADKGFFLNGKHRKFQGVCNHHDLGPLGAAINVAALRRQLVLLKDMGCDAIRTGHTMPAPELVELCDEMGMMLMVESFDEWDLAKCDNGYHRFFAEWAEKDMVNAIRHYRNNPSVVMWSIGNEVPTQWKPEGCKVAMFLQDICHREDPTRPVTCGMDQVSSVLDNGFAAAPRASRASDCLCDKGKCSFVSAEVIEKKSTVCRDDSDKRKLRKIMPFGDHLCTDKNICFAAAESSGHFILRETSLCGIRIHAEDFCIRKKRSDFIFNPLCAVSGKGKMLAAAFRTKMRYGNAVSAVMAKKSFSSPGFVMR